MSPGEIGPFLARTTPRLLVVVFGVMIALFVATGFFTKSYNREKRERAAQQHEAGGALAEAGRYDDAAEMFAEAMTLSRGKDQYAVYQQALALALVDAGRMDEAETYLQELTTRDPSNGIANLMLARIYVDGDLYDRAMEHYHRAIYGLWPENPRDHRIQVRVELVGLFEQSGQYTEMEAELLRLLQEIPDDPEVKKRIGRMFMTAESYDYAADIFTAVAGANRQDAEAYAGLGDAEFERGHYLSAGTAYRRALRYRPDDLQSRTQLELCEEIIRLDPMLRGLGSATRLERSQELVSRSLRGLDYCLPEDEETLPEGIPDILEKARNLAAGRTRQQRNSEAVEENIALAEELENYRRLNCGSAPVPDLALERVLKKLAN